MDLNIITHPAENEQLRAAVCGRLVTKAGTITQPHKEWLMLIHEDVITLLGEGIRQSQQGQCSWLFPIRQEILEWPDKDLLGQLMLPAHMTWIRGVTSELVFRTYEELHVVQAKNEADTLHCQLSDKDGNACNFQGTPVSMGQHMWIIHRKCNPAKALVVTNECPACRNIFANLKSAKENAYAAYKAGRCPDSNKFAPRPFLSELTLEKIYRYQCHVCQQNIEGHDKTQEHLRSHFLALLVAYVAL